MSMQRSESVKEGNLGWILSALLHVGVATAAFVGLPHLSRPLPTPPPPIAIEFVKIDEQTRQTAPVQEEEKPIEEEEQEPVAAAAPPVESMPAPAPDPAPVIDKAPPVKVEEPAPMPKPQPKPEVSEARQLASNISPRAKPQAPSRFKISRISSVIDKSIKEEQKIAKPVAEAKPEKKKTEKPEDKPNMFSALQGSIATASLRDALSQKLAGCWTFPRGAKGVEKMQVTVRIWLMPDGKLSRPPEFVDAGDLNDPDRAFYRVFAESARRAVRLCEPFDEASQYIGAGQKYIDFIFNGAEFAGG